MGPLSKSGAKTRSVYRIRTGSIRAVRASAIAAVLVARLTGFPGGLRPAVFLGWLVRLVGRVHQVEQSSVEAALCFGLAILIWTARGFVFHA